MRKYKNKIQEQDQVAVKSNSVSDDDTKILHVEELSDTMFTVKELRDCLKDIPDTSPIYIEAGSLTIRVKTVEYTSQRELIITVTTKTIDDELKEKGNEKI